MNGGVALHLPAMDVSWSCEVCGRRTSDSDELLRHVWTEHAAQLLRENPWFYVALWEMANKQAVLRREVFGASVS